jgi:hypothetical protein
MGPAKGAPPLRESSPTDAAADRQSGLSQDAIDAAIKKRHERKRRK